jgi:hypothetical protein
MGRFFWTTLGVISFLLFNTPVFAQQDIRDYIKIEGQPVRMEFGADKEAEFLVARFSSEEFIDFLISHSHSLSCSIEFLGKDCRIRIPSVKEAVVGRWIKHPEPTRVGQLIRRVESQDPMVVEIVRLGSYGADRKMGPHQMFCTDEPPSIRSVNQITIDMWSGEFNLPNLQTLVPENQIFQGSYLPVLERAEKGWIFKSLGVPFAVFSETNSVSLIGDVINLRVQQFGPHCSLTYKGDIISLIDQGQKLKTPKAYKPYDYVKYGVMDSQELFEFRFGEFE